MRTVLKNAVAAVIVGAALGAVPSLAADARKETAETMMTVYVSAHTGNGLAKDINETHARMEAEGWRFADMEVHTENGDTEGAWITYTK
jgi:hypothetical protein